MINKELFEAIMGFDVIEFEVINTDGKPEKIDYYPASLPRVRCIDWKPTLLSINIYEFAHKNLKEWANLQGYWLHSHGCHSLINGSYIESGSAFISLNSDIPTNIFKITLSTEFEAIFEAAKYVLNTPMKTDPKSKAISLDKTYTTRNGKKAKVYYLDAGGSLPVHGSIFVDGEWIMKNWTINGLRNSNFTQSDLDLIEVLK
jgi:hypothetical protein